MAAAGIATRVAPGIASAMGPWTLSRYRLNCARVVPGLRFRTTMNFTIDADYPP